MLNTKIDVFGGNRSMVTWPNKKSGNGEPQVNGFGSVFSKEMWTNNHNWILDKFHRVDG